MLCTFELLLNASFNSAPRPSLFLDNGLECRFTLRCVDLEAAMYVVEDEADEFDQDVIMAKTCLI